MLLKNRIFVYRYKKYSKYHKFHSAQNLPQNLSQTECAFSSPTIFQSTGKLFSKCECFQWIYLMFFVWYLNLLTSLGLGDVPILIFVKHGSADTITLVKLNAWNWPHCDLKTSPNTTKPTITTKLTLKLCSTTIPLLLYHFCCFYHTLP